MLYVKLYNYYWYVIGLYFFILYEKFEEFYNEVGMYIDELVECILVLEGKLLVIMKEYFVIFSVSEGISKEFVEEMV